MAKSKSKSTQKSNSRSKSSIYKFTQPQSEYLDNFLEQYLEAQEETDSVQQCATLLDGVLDSLITHFNLGSDKRDEILKVIMLGNIFHVTLLIYVM